MKKIVFIALMLLTFCSYSQNYVDLSKSEVKELLKQSGEYFTEDNENCISTENRVTEVIKVYCFNEDNVCVVYVVSYKTVDKSYLEKNLNKHYTKSGNNWYSKNCKIQLNWDAEFQRWSIFFIKL